MAAKPAGMTKKPNVDWEGIEREYCAGQLSLVEIGKMYGISDARVCQVAKKKGWVQDLGSRIKAQAQARLNEELVSESLNAEAKEANANERVAAGAEALTKIILGHRTSIKNLRARVAKYNEELEVCGDDLGKRTAILKTLADTEKSLVALERQAFGMGDANDKTENGSNEPQLSPIEAGRRVAFLLMNAAKEA